MDAQISRADLTDAVESPRAVLTAIDAGQANKLAEVQARLLQYMGLTDEDELPT